MTPVELPTIPDLEVVRRALAAATPPVNDYTTAAAVAKLKVNAPVWLAQCIQEIERLRALYVESEGVKGWDYANVVAERNAALAKLDGYRSDHAALMGERNAALAECERLRSVFAVINEWPVAKERDAWRACADQLAPYALRHSRYDSTGPVNEALAVYETLKATS